MWEVAFLIIALAFTLLVVFLIPAILQLRDAAKELEFTLRRTRETLDRVMELSRKAETFVDKGTHVVVEAERAVVAMDAFLGKAGTRTLTKVLSVALEAFPMAMTARKLFQTYRRR
jgi:predicted PurR-regulated permease PerM